MNTDEVQAAIGRTEMQMAATEGRGPTVPLLREDVEVLLAEVERLRADLIESNELSADRADLARRWYENYERLRAEREEANLDAIAEEERRRWRD